MLRDLDKKLIEKEKHRFDTKEFKRDLFPLESCPIAYEALFTKYDLHEFTEHWYDGDPPQCRLCNNYICEDCNARKQWMGSEEQLSFNNWIDVWGPGIWDMNQSECNRMVKDIFRNEIYKDTEMKDRLFWYQPPTQEYFHMFYYNRDRKNKDYYFIFKMREGTQN